MVQVSENILSTITPFLQSAAHLGHKGNKSLFYGFNKFVGQRYKISETILTSRQ